MADISLQLQADNLPIEAVEKLLVSSNVAGAVLKRLVTAENLLLEGCRGVGKTMLMRAAAERLATSVRAGGKTLGVHATFKRYLATIPPPASGGEAPELMMFKVWVNARILGAVRERIDGLDANDKVKACRVLKVDWRKLISLLETAYKGGAHVEAALPSVGLTMDDYVGLQGYTLASEMLDEVRSSLDLELIVLLLDDAAHSLDTRAQGAFFTLVKSLYRSGLAFKISVYPAVTRYGMDFAYGHDATVVSLVTPPTAKETIETQIEMLRKRSEAEGEFTSLIRDIVQSRRDWAELLVWCANGNPRGLLKLIAEVASEASISGSVSYSALRTAINKVTDRHLEHMIPGIIKDIDPRLLKAAEELLERFREKIRLAPLQGDAARIHLAISTSPQVPYLCTAGTRLLVSANVLIYVQPQRLSSRDNGASYLLHPGFVFRDNVLSGSVGAARWNEYFATAQPGYHAEFSKSANLWTEVREVAMEEPSARCSAGGHPMPDANMSCEVCGSRANPRGPVALVLEKPIEALDLSEKIKDRLRRAGLTSVGKVFEATDARLDDIYYIGEQRIKEIRSAVESAVDEYFAG